MTTFASTLRKLCREMDIDGRGPAGYTRRGMSQLQLANMVEVDHSLVSRWMSGSRNPERKNVIACADALRLTGNDRAELFASAGYWPDHWDVADIWQWPGYRITIYDGVERAPGQRGATIGPEMTNSTLTRENVSGDRGAS
jgi:transcriptional regulator with XRE-family HTH domain